VVRPERRRRPEVQGAHVATLTRTLGGSTRLDKISELTVEKHKRARTSEGKKAGTVNRELVTLKHFLNRCVDWDWLPKRPKVTLLREPAPRVRWLTDAESRKLAAELAKPQRQHFRRVVEAALLSGQRLSVVIGLKKADVDLKHRTLSYVQRKRGNKPPVTKHAPVSDALAAVLSAAMADGAGEHVFTSGRFGKPYTRSGASSFFRKVATEAGIEDLHFHDLRHHYATQVRRAGHGLDVVQALLGHESPAMTARYAHLGREELASAAAAVSPLPALADLRLTRRKRGKRSSIKQAVSRH
jgi:integrase